MAEKDKFADEVLSDDELDNVVGGNYDETSDDSKFLNIYGLCEKYTKSDIFFDSGTSQEEDVNAGWAKVGVDFHYHSGRGSFGTHNEYYISGNKVSRKEAHLHALLQLSPMAQQIWEAIKSK